MTILAGLPDRAGARPPHAGDVAVTAWSLHLPGTGLTAVVPGLPAEPGAPACPAHEAHQLLGRKGLLNKDAATRLALCAAHRALGLRPGTGQAAGPPDPGVAVVASSNLGNVGTVVDVVRTVRADRSREISPLSAPRASSNVLSSAVAIWFGFAGPNFMLCSGATSGMDAVIIGARLVRAGRASRVVVVGAEPADEAAAALHRLRGPGRPALREGAACVILQAAGQAPGAPLLRPVPDGTGVPVGGAGEAIVVAGADAHRVGSRDGPGGPAFPAAWVIGLTAAVGDLYGTLGVAQIAVAAAIAGARNEPGCIRAVCGDASDGWRAADIIPRPKAKGQVDPHL
jgi:3-oxoacyl-[acyl-carrier-protein] synthase II